jgi:hypothetical protein
MFSRLISFVWPMVLVASLVGLSACAGSKSGSSSNSSSSSEEPKNTKVEDARRSAEDAEAKAHQIREEKSRNPSKTSSN